MYDAIHVPRGKDLDYVHSLGARRQSHAIWLYDFDAKAITWANESALELWSASTVEELANRRLGDEMSPNVASRLGQFREDFIVDENRRFHESWTLYPRGRPILVDCTFMWCHLPSGRECTVVEGALRNSNKPTTLRSIDALMNSQVMTALYSDEGEELYANRALREALGPGPLPFGSGFVSPRRRNAVLNALRQHGQHRETIAIQTRDGTRYFDTQTVSCHDAATGSKAFQFSATDVTTAREYERALRAARDKAESADRAKSEFVANMSHEMRTPMNGILGLVDVLGHTELTPQQRQHIEVIRGSAQALLSLIEDVLDLSSIELRAMKTELVEFNLHTLVKTVVEGLRTPAVKKHLGLSFSLSPDLPESWTGDSRRTAQLMRNLIGNAIKYTDKGSVRVDVSSESNNLRVDVIDTGPGVPQEERKRIFEKFHQASSPEKARQGVGLGLSICKEIVELLDGKIGVNSAEPHGSCFWFTLPRPTESVPSRSAQM